MDIKLKDSKTGMITAILLVLLASVGFISLYPRFRSNADFYIAEFNEDVMVNEDFLCDLYKGNTILYKDLQEQITGTPLKYQDVYLMISEEQPSYDASEYISFDGESAAEYAGRKLYQMLKGWEDDFWENLDHNLDYQIVDAAGNTMITNTEHDIGQLGSKEASEELLSTYPYYIKLRYDDAGFLEHVWVKGSDSDRILKNVQRVMKSSMLERSLYDSGFNDGYAGALMSNDTIYYYHNNNTMSVRIGIQNTPRNCTICYALTQEQMNFFIDENYYHQMIAPYHAYRMIGVANVFCIFLIVLGILALLMPLWKKYHLHELWIFQLHLEILLFLLFVMFAFMGEAATKLVIYSMTGGSDYAGSYMLTAIYTAFPELSMEAAKGIAVGINMVCLFLMFGFWYLFVTALGQVHTLGIKNYIKERSICYRVCRKVHGYGQRQISSFKEEILHVDLGQNTNKTLLKIVVVNFLLLALLSTLWFAGLPLLLLYSAVLYLALKKYIKRIQVQYKHLLVAAQSMADGNLQTEFTGDWGVFESYKSNLAEIQQGFSKAVEEEVKSQRMRTELITNVSHDLKTPLTAITTYIELLQEEGVTKEQQKEYLDVLERKARRLKILIEDLFEVSKANSGNISLQFDKVDIGNLMRQVYLEYEDKVEEADLIFRFQMPEEKQFLMLDSEKTYRIFENLYTNIIKYAMPAPRVYVRMEREDDQVMIELKNMSRAELNIAPESLTERFVRGDSSRNTEGSGLGLAIARSFVELQKGQMKVEIDGDLFKVTIVWKGL